VPAVNGLMEDPAPVSVPSAARRLVERILAFAAEKPELRDDLRERLEGVLASEDAQAVGRLIQRLMTTGNEFGYYPPDPLARRIQHEVAKTAVTNETKLVGVENLAGVLDQPLIFLSNHLSYSDANMLEVLLLNAELAGVADRLTVVVGPKVYSDPFRRFSSLCFGTIKTPQSAARSSEEAVMSTREVARLARETIAVAAERQAAGDALLIFVEGARSRSGAMQRSLQGIARYFEEPERVLVPLGLQGTERLVPVGDERLYPTHVTFRIGRPVPARVLAERCGTNRSLRMDVIGAAIASLLPPEYRGVYADDVPDQQEAREIAAEIFGEG
jgi:1-acyl-sn-glycerol-3-phosphate acyltransferase